MIAEVRRLADIESFTARYSDTAITEWINKGIVAYRELIGASMSRVLRMMSDDATWAANTASVELEAGALPDVARLLGLYMLDDDGKTWYPLEEVTSNRGVGMLRSALYPGRPLYWWWEQEGRDLFIAPRSDRARSYRYLYEASAVALSGGTDAFQSLVPRGVEWVETFAALKYCVRDGATEQYQLLSSEMQKCENSIRARTGAATGGTVRRRDTRGERALDQGIDPNLWQWPEMR